MIRHVTPFLIAAAISFGCSDPAPRPDGSGGGESTDTGADSGTGTGLNTATTSDTWTATETNTGSSTDTGEAYACWDSPDEATCLDCCASEYEAELGRLEDYLVQRCVCHKPANPVCHLACENWCPSQGQTPDANCAACMESVFASYAGCVGNAEELCLEASDCAPIVECQNGC